MLYMSLFPLSKDLLLCPPVDQKFRFPTDLLPEAEILFPAVVSRTYLWLMETWSLMFSLVKGDSRVSSLGIVDGWIQTALPWCLPGAELLVILFSNPLYPVSLSFNLQVSLIVEINVFFYFMSKHGVHLQGIYCSSHIEEINHLWKKMSCCMQWAQ